MRPAGPKCRVYGCSRPATRTVITIDPAGRPLTILVCSHCQQAHWPGPPAQS